MIARYAGNALKVITTAVQYLLHFGYIILLNTPRSRAWFGRQ
jgi:hypothetical protein